MAYRQTRAKRSVALTFATIVLLLGSAAQAGTINSKDWSGQCDGSKVCFVQMGNAGPRLLVGWNRQDKQIRVLVLLPPDVGTGKAVTIWVDDNYSMYLQSNSCTKTFCQAVVDAKHTQAVIDTLKKAGKGVLAFPEAGRLKVSPISLYGFSKAYAAVVRGLK